MLISVSIILVTSLSGLALTYLFAEKETILWRLAAGTVIGAAVFGLVGFLVANFFGLSVATILTSLAIASIPLLILRNKQTGSRAKGEWQHSKDKLQGASFKKFWRFTYYLFFFVLFVAFFDRAMIIGEDGIFTGASQNLGDLPFHLGSIFGFTDGNNFPPQNPSFSDVKFTYPFIADFLTACLVKLGASVQAAMLVQNVFWAFSLLVVLERFVFKLTANRLAGKLAPFLLFFSGGLGFVWFFHDYWFGTQGFFGMLWNLPQDYTIGDNFRWGNSLITLFVTQRSLLLGLPITIVVLHFLFQVFERGRAKIPGRVDSDSVEAGKTDTSILAGYLPPFVVGLLAGMLPLIHAHSLAVLFLVSAILFFLSLRIWKKWIMFAAGVCLIAVPELIWILNGAATNTSEFFAWHFGFDARDDNILWFWFKNTGMFIPIAIAGFLLIYLPHFSGKRDAAAEEPKVDDGKKEKVKKRDSKAKRFTSTVALFFLPFVFLFIIGNVAKLAPWEWDNIKVLIYWFIGSIPFAAFFLAWVWQKNGAYRFVAVACIIILTLSGGLDVWRTASAQMRHQVFDKDAVEIADAIKKNTAPNALFLNAPTYNSAVVLSGRRSLMRYIGHLSSHGIDYRERESDLKRIYSGAATADIFLKKYGIEYVLISPIERESLQVDEQFFQKYPLAAEAGGYKVYRVK
jgi:hypothetical protein